MAVKGALFSTSGSEIVCGGNDVTINGYTIVTVIRPPSSNPGVDCVVFWSLAPGPSAGWAVDFDYASPSGFFYATSGGADYWGTIGTDVPLGEYSMTVGCVNSAGTVGATHLYSTSTGWVHMTSPDELAVGPASGTIDSINFSAPLFGLNMTNFEVAYAAVFQETGAIPTNSQIETLLDYNVLEYKLLKRFSTGRSLQGAGTIVDTSGNGNHETSRTSISTGTADVPSWFANFDAAMPVIDRGTFQSAAGGGTLDLSANVSSSSFTPAAGSQIVVGLAVNANNQFGTTTQVQFNLSDTFGDTGGTAWASTGAFCSRGDVVNGAYMERVELFTRKIGTSPGSGVVRFNTTKVAGSGVNTNDGWQMAHAWEISGQHTSSPVGGFSTTPAAAQNVASFAPDLGATPAATSAVFSVIHNDNNAGTGIFTEPTGFAEVELNQATWGAATAWGFKVGNNVQAPSWGTVQNASQRILGASVEIKIAAASATGRPKYWNGSAWVQKPMKVWNGSAWVEKPVKYWNGSSWVTVT